MRMNSVKIVEEFWERVWKARNPAAIDNLVIDDFVIRTGCVDVVSRTKLKEWAAAFIAKINGLQFEVIETFQNEDGGRVASRWRIAGKNNGTRALINEADPGILEEWKWMGTPVWSHNGIVCTGETYKNVVKMTFSKGASLKDPARLFNSSLDGNARRALDIHEGEEIDAPALKALIRAAVALNVSGRKAAPPKRGGR
jgi:hypothetical protein